MVILQLDEQTPLIQSVFAGDADDVGELLGTGGEEVNATDPEKRTALHAAAFRGDVAVASVLIAHGARVNAKDSKWYTPLHRACCTGSEETVSLLLGHRADALARDRLWQTPLHVAAANDAYHCVDRILTHVPNPNVTDRSGRTALHHAAFNGHVQVAELLITKGCAVNACDKKDCRPLHYAAYSGHLNTIDLLLRCGADLDCRDRNGYTALHAAAASGSEGACCLLLASGADAVSRNAYGNTPLHVACLNGHASVCRELTAYGADIEAQNHAGYRPLHVAAASAHGVDCMTFLLERGANIDARGADGRTPLHVTAVHGRFTRSKMLIDRGAVVDAADKNGYTALHVAAQHGHELLSTTLLSFGADPAKKGFKGRTPLHICCFGGHVECCRKFVQAGVDLDARDDFGKTATHYAAYKGSVECLDLLVSSKANFQLADNIGRLPLHYAVLDGHYQCTFTLVGIGSHVDAVDAEGCSPLHLSAAHDFSGKCVEYLLQHKGDPMLKDRRGFTPLHYAVVGKNLQALEHLLTNIAGKHMLYGQGMSSTTPLHLAARNGSAEILCLIIPHFPDPNLRTETGLTPLMVAAREGHAPCVQLLLRYGAKVALQEDANGSTALHASAANGHVHSLALLLDNAEDGTAVNMADRRGRTALMLGVSGDHFDCVTTLLKSGANPNLRDADGHSALFRAVAFGYQAIVRLLLAEGAEVRSRDANGKTVVHVAAACGHLECLKAVVDKTTAEETRQLDDNDCGTLHWACYAGSVKCVEYLLSQKIFEELEGNAFSPVHCAVYSGSESCVELLCKRYTSEIVRLKDGRERTPLHIAAAKGHVDCASLLLREGAEVEAGDEEDRTPLIVSAQNGQTSVADLLLKHGADVTVRDKSGNTALHWACVRKHCRTALMLLDYPDRGKDVVNMTNVEGKTALHLAARNGLVEVTRKLLRTGASVFSVDSEGMTPALACAPNRRVARCLSFILDGYVRCREGSTKDVRKQPRLRRLKRKKVLTSSKCQTDDVCLFRVVCHENAARQCENDPFRSESSGSVSVKPCADCEKSRGRCANCVLRKLMRQHVTGKLSIEDLKTILTKICLDSDPDYKRTMIEALENFKDTIRERKLRTSSANRIDSFIDAVICNRSLRQIRRFDSFEQIYARPEKRRRVVARESVAVGPFLKVIESTSNDKPVKIDRNDRATYPILHAEDLESIERDRGESECSGKLREIPHVESMLQSKSEPNVSRQTCVSTTEAVDPEMMAEIEKADNELFFFEVEECREDCREVFVEAEECALKETKSLTVLKKKFSITKWAL